MISVGAGINGLLKAISFGAIDFTPKIAHPVDGWARYLTNTSVLFSSDPNFISGPVGYGSAGYIPVEGAIGYTIGFQNEPTASAPAQVVRVIQPLDAGLDWSTFQLVLSVSAANCSRCRPA